MQQPKLSFTFSFQEFVNPIEKINLFYKFKIQVEERIDLNEDIRDLILNLSFEQII